MVGLTVPSRITGAAVRPADVEPGAELRLGGAAASRAFPSGPARRSQTRSTMPPTNFAWVPGWARGGTPGRARRRSPSPRCPGPRGPPCGRDEADGDHDDAAGALVLVVGEGVVDVRFQPRHVRASGAGLEDQRVSILRPRGPGRGWRGRRPGAGPVRRFQGGRQVARAGGLGVGGRDGVGDEDDPHRCVGCRAAASWARTSARPAVTPSAKGSTKPGWSKYCGPCRPPACPPGRSRAGRRRGPRGTAGSW